MLKSQHSHQAETGCILLIETMHSNGNFADFTGTRAKKSDQISFEGRLLGILVPKADLIGHYQYGLVILI